MSFQALIAKSLEVIDRNRWLVCPKRFDMSVIELRVFNVKIIDNLFALFKEDISP